MVRGWYTSKACIHIYDFSPSYNCEGDIQRCPIITLSTILKRHAGVFFFLNQVLFQKGWWFFF